MTTVRIYRKAGSIAKIEVSGHSGYAPEGEDIVCAAITSAVRYAEVLLNEVLQLQVPFDVRSDAVFLSFSVPSPAGGAFSLCEPVFQGFAQYMKELSAEYQNYMKVMEVQLNA